MARARIDPDHVMVKMGMSLLPPQRERLMAYAREREIGVSEIIRGLVREWERKTFPSGA